MRIVVADDEAPARAKLARWLAEQPEVEVLAQAADGIAAAEAIAAHRPDAVLLDIQMPGCSGLEVAAQLEADSAPAVVFVTAYDEHAVRAFDLNAVDYLLKPYDHERFLRMLDRLRVRLRRRDSGRAAVQIARRDGAHRLLVPEGNGLSLIDCRSILWLQADDNYVEVCTTDRRYLLRRTLRDLLAQLGSAAFAQIHKSIAVNITEIQALSPLFKGDYEVTLRNGQRLRLSRRFRAALFASIGQR